MNERICCQCESQAKLVNRYGYLFCSRCESSLALHSDKTILKNAQSYQESKPTSYEDEVVRRLEKMDRDFARTKVKLLHILERLAELI